MSNASNSSASKALTAALSLFAQHGFHRTSMADIAEAAGVSRATLYIHFKDKETLFRALADSVVTESLQHMRDAWKEDGSFGRNLEAAILAKDGRLRRFIHTFPHGRELLAANGATTLACAQVLDGGFIEFLCSRAREEEVAGRHFEVFGGVPGFGVFVAQAAAGFKDAIASEQLYQTAIHTFVELVEIATK